jgi:hypothetical protein
VSDIENAATNAQMTNPFDTTKGGSDILQSGAAAADATPGVNTPGQIYYSEDAGAYAYYLQGIGHDGNVLIDLNVNYAE